MNGKGNGEYTQGLTARIGWSLIAYLLLLGALWVGVDLFNASVDLFSAPFAEIEKIPLDPEHAAISADKKAKLTIAAYEYSSKLALGILGVFGLFFAAWRTWVAERNLKTDRERLATETFSEAIKQLGARDGGGKPILEMRLGGIYTLERLMKETGDHDFYWQIVETLTAYVRENSPASGAAAFTPPAPPNDWGDGTQTANYQESIQRSVAALQNPLKDIQAIVTVIGRRPKAKDRGRVPDLSETNLQKINMSRFDAGKLNLTGAHLEGAHLSGAHLEGAYLIGARLEGAHLSGAHFEGTRFGFFNDPASDAVGLTVKQLERAYGDHATVLPTYLKDTTINWRKDDKASAE